jgi:VanZ family protein
MLTDRPVRPAATTAARVLCLIAAAAILLQLFTPGLRPAAASLIVEPWDKVAHFVVYATLAGSLWIATGARAPLLVIAATIAVGALDELHQIGIPGRSADALDFLADTCAVAAMVAFLAVRTPRLSDIKKGPPCAA